MALTAGWVVRTCNPFISIRALFYAAVRPEGPPSDDAGHDYRRSEAEVERQAALLSSYRRAAEFSPWLDETLDTIFDNPDTFKADIHRFITQFRRKASNVRANDVRLMNEQILYYAARALRGPKVENPRLVPHISSRAAKGTTRGFRHVELALLLCPVAHKDDTINDPAKYSKLYLTGERKNRASSMPWFLFCPTEYAARADPRDRKAGLFKGPLMVMGARHLFTGRHSVHAQVPIRPKGKQCLASKYEWTRPTPKSLCYVAIIVYHALSDSVAFDVEMGAMSKQRLYQNLLGLFAKDPVWGEQLLDWYAACMYMPGAQGAVDEDDGEEDDFAIFAESVPCAIVADGAGDVAAGAADTGHHRGVGDDIDSTASSAGNELPPAGDDNEQEAGPEAGGYLHDDSGDEAPTGFAPLFDEGSDDNQGGRRRRRYATPAQSPRASSSRRPLRRLTPVPTDDDEGGRRCRRDAARSQSPRSSPSRGRPRRSTPAPAKPPAPAKARAPAKSPAAKKVPKRKNVPAPEQMLPTPTSTQDNGGKKSKKRIAADPPPADSVSRRTRARGGEAGEAAA